jgi:hypothetical protein
VHRAELSLMPNWIGADQVRQVAVDGDWVTVTAPPLLIGGQQQIATQVWQRV